MKRARIVSLCVFSLLLSTLAGLQYLVAFPSVPPALHANDCSPARADEPPNTQFIRKGGRITRYVKVLHDGSTLTVKDVSQGRDLHRYDKLVVTDVVPRTVKDKGRETFLHQARNFIWSHWRVRMRGYLVLTGSSVDATSTSHVFIEPDDAGKWRVYWSIVRHKSEIDDLPTTYDLRLTEENKLQFRDVCGDWGDPF
jgi:hypothetical protein